MYLFVYYSLQLLLATHTVREVHQISTELRSKNPNVELGFIDKEGSFELNQNTEKTSLDEFIYPPVF